MRWNPFVCFGFGGALSHCECGGLTVNAVTQGHSNRTVTPLI